MKMRKKAGGQWPLLNDINNGKVLGNPTTGSTDFVPPPQRPYLDPSIRATPLSPPTYEEAMLWRQRRDELRNNPNTSRRL